VENKPNEIVRAHIWVKGRVQGVGFRAHVEYFALQIEVTGWVRNVGRDTVEAVAEGRREIVERFIDMVEEGPRMARVDSSKVEWEAATGEHSGFVVKQNI
jgi:acylphosphatase